MFVLCMCACRNLVILYDRIKKRGKESSSQRELTLDYSRPVENNKLTIAFFLFAAIYIQRIERVDHTVKVVLLSWLEPRRGQIQDGLRLF